MPILILETEINAPPEICFDLVRDVSLHVQTGKKEFAGKKHDDIKLGETVTFEGKHFGISQRLTVKVIEFERPRVFTDEMTEGNFKSFKHKHEFITQSEGTLIRDTLEWTSPFGFVGRIVDAVLLKNHLRKLVSRRNAELKQIAEAKSF